MIKELSEFKGGVNANHILVKHGFIWEYFMKIKFQNTKSNRKALVEAGYKVYDPHCTFNRKAWIIIGTDGLLYGVDRRHFPVISVEEFLGE